MSNHLELDQVANVIQLLKDGEFGSDVYRTILQLVSLEVYEELYKLTSNLEDKDEDEPGSSEWNELQGWRAVNRGEDTPWEQDVLLRMLAEHGPTDTVKYAIAQGHFQPRHITLVHRPDFWELFFQDPKLYPNSTTLKRLAIRVAYGRGTETYPNGIDHALCLLKYVSPEKEEYSGLVAYLLALQEPLTSEGLLRTLEEYKIDDDKIKSVISRYLSKAIASPQIVKTLTQKFDSLGGQLLFNIFIRVEAGVRLYLTMEELERYHTNAKLLLEATGSVPKGISPRSLKKTVLESMRITPEGKSLLIKFADLFEQYEQV